ncbi:hypothetical protein HZA97_07435 [Candidatus Woesearchaeota archaeon]|nr:hypothetical protein [Candidatus Woesearchaeota archaeon]
MTDLETTKELTDILVVLKGEYALEVLAGVYNNSKPEHHPYVDFIKRYGKVHKITGWNLIYCSMQEKWVDHEYHLVEHIYKKGEKILKEHENRSEVVSALEELNKKLGVIQAKIVEQVEEKETTTKVTVVNEEIPQKAEEKIIQNEEATPRKLERVL